MAFERGVVAVVISVALPLVSLTVVSDWILVASAALDVVSTISVTVVDGSVEFEYGVVFVLFLQ